MLLRSWSLAGRRRVQAWLSSSIRVCVPYQSRELGLRMTAAAVTVATRMSANASVMMRYPRFDRGQSMPMALGQSISRYRRDNYKPRRPITRLHGTYKSGADQIADVSLVSPQDHLIASTPWFVSPNWSMPDRSQPREPRLILCGQD